MINIRETVELDSKGYYIYKKSFMISRIRLSKGSMKYDLTFDLKVLLSV